MSSIYNTGVASLMVQVSTALFDIYVLTLKQDPSLFIVRDLLHLELFVQMIEGAFYIWLVYNLAKHPNITPLRYYDWVITTPTMLVSYCLYLVYVRNKEDTASGKKTFVIHSFSELFFKNLPTLVPIFILNTLMLLFGYLAEIGKISHIMGAFLGFIPFFAFFYMIYENYAKHTSVGRWTFWYFSGVWGLYGIASVLSYNIKNVFYNILDLFSKNFFGIFLAYILYMNRLTE